jgi:hypothetical protein
VPGHRIKKGLSPRFRPFVVATLRFLSQVIASTSLILRATFQVEGKLEPSFLTANSTAGTTGTDDLTCSRLTDKQLIFKRLGMRLCRWRTPGTPTLGRPSGKIFSLFVTTPVLAPGLHRRPLFLGQH